MGGRLPYQIGIVVGDLERAQEELTRAFGLSWEPTIDAAVGEWSIRLAHSVDGPPHLELIEGEAGSPWDPSGGSRIDHLGWWSEDLAADKQRSVADGAAVELESEPGFSPGFSYHRLPQTGLRFELVEDSYRDDYYARLRR
jgi:Glyoxalase/Bleomycin resistance protein/Dioxygenase superfamily